jgi:hypothetical protein
MLAELQSQTSVKAMQASLSSASEVVAALRSNLMFGAFAHLQSHAGEVAGGAELLEEVASVFRQDELNKKLAPALRTLAERAQELMRRTPVPPAASGERVYEAERKAASAAQAAAVVSELAQQAREQLGKAAGGPFTVKLVVERKG